jgi:SAM-dependent methyltransferase
MPANYPNSPRNQRLLPANQFIPAAKDQEFDRVYPEAIRDLSVVHWSPVNVCRLAAKLLVIEPGTRVLDIGCGPGKFCAIGAATTKGHFTGIEQRPRLARAAKDLIQRNGISRAEILQGNVTGVNFDDFDAFYLFNPFEENIFPDLRIDFDVELEPSLYTHYIERVQQELSRMPAGTRVVTYCGNSAEIPGGYECQKMAFDGKLKLWVKTDAPPATRGAACALATKFRIIGRGPCGLVPA